MILEISACNHIHTSLTFSYSNECNGQVQEFESFKLMTDRCSTKHNW